MHHCLCHLPTVFRKVVPPPLARQWVSFLRSHSHIFVVFLAGENCCQWRVRLWSARPAGRRGPAAGWRCGWRAADHRENCDREIRRRAWLDAVRRFLLACERPRVPVDEFMASPFAVHEAPMRRGDLIRLVRRHPETARYDPDTYELYLPPI